MATRNEKELSIGSYAKEESRVWPVFVSKKVYIGARAGNEWKQNWKRICFQVQTAAFCW
jgi:hypothetical protein